MFRPARRVRSYEIIFPFFRFLDVVSRNVNQNFVAVGNDYVCVSRLSFARSEEYRENGNANDYRDKKDYDKFFDNVLFHLRSPLSRKHTFVVADARKSFRAFNRFFVAVVKQNKIGIHTHKFLFIGKYEFGYRNTSENNQNNSQCRKKNSVVRPHHKPRFVYYRIIDGNYRKAVAREIHRFALPGGRRSDIFFASVSFNRDDCPPSSRYRRLRAFRLRFRPARRKP